MAKIVWREKRMEMGKRKRNKVLAWLLAFLMMMACPGGLQIKADAQESSSQMVLTLGADLTDEQKAYILQYFGVSESSVTTITVTNADERSQLGGLIPDEQIGTHTLSCALIKVTTAGGVNVKTANMNYVTANMIASQLCTSGVYNCEVLTAAPFEVSGTGALTGAMMAYETATGAALDEDKKSLANEELVLTGEIAETVGQEQATLVVNDIKITILRDQTTGEEEVVAAVDAVIATTEQAAAEAAAEQGLNAPETLGDVAHEQLYNYGYKYSQMGYKYSDVQQTLERVTYNVTKETGIDDPIMDTFSTSYADSSLSLESILLNTDDSVLGEDAIISATSTSALGEHEPEEIEVFTGEVTLTEAGLIKAESFISNTNLLAYQDAASASYSLLDLNGNLLTEAIYTDDFTGAYGYVFAVLDDGSGACGLLDTDGATVIPFQYGTVFTVSEQWAAGVTLAAGTDDDYDFYDYSGGRYIIDTADVYYLGGETPVLAGTLTRDQIADYQASGDYLNIQDRSGIITTYDSSLTALQTTDSIYDFGSYDEDETLIELLEESTGYNVYSFKGGYAEYYDSSTGACGVIDRYGNVIIPAEYDDILYSNDTGSYVGGGYFAAESGDNFIYLTSGGTVTASYACGSLYCDYNGMSTSIKQEDGSYVLLAGDGTLTDLGSSYSYLTVFGSDGMFWVGYTGSGYDLLDWHGNVLFSGSDSDGYSISANGNYLIVQNGYTSSTLYLVNGASMVSIADSVGGAEELEVSVGEAASMEAYTGEPAVELIGEVWGTSFAEGTDLILVTDGSAYALFDTGNNQLTSAAYTRYFDYEDGWLIATSAEDGSLGLISSEGGVAIPCGYDYIQVLNEYWVIGYIGIPNGTDEDYDYYSDGTYYLIEEATIYHLSDEELTYVTLSRDQMESAYVDGEYINIKNRESGTITTYDSTFTAVASVSSLYDFSSLTSFALLIKQLQDSTGLKILDSGLHMQAMEDGYLRVYTYEDDATKYGVIDMSGNLIVPVEYDKIQSYSNPETRYWARGYFAVTQDGMAGYVTQDGVVTCEIKYEEDNFDNNGIAARYHNEDGTYSVVAADGTVTDVQSYPSAYGGGLFWRVSSAAGSGLDLLDWHGNLLFENVVNVDVSDDARFIIVQETYDDMPLLYAVDGASTADAVAAAAGEDSGADTESSSEDSSGEETDLEKAGAAETVSEADTDTAETVSDSASEAAEAESDSGTESEDASGNDTAGAAVSLLESALVLLDNGLEANETNKDSVLVLLQQAQTLLEAENPDAAALISSAVTLLQAGTADTTSVSTLITTAMGMAGTGSLTSEDE